MASSSIIANPTEQCLSIKLRIADPITFMNGYCAPQTYDYSDLGRFEDEDGMGVALVPKPYFLGAYKKGGLAGVAAVINGLALSTSAFVFNFVGQKQSCYFDNLVTNPEQKAFSLFLKGNGSELLYIADTTTVECLREKTDDHTSIYRISIPVEDLRHMGQYMDTIRDDEVLPFTLRPHFKKAARAITGAQKAAGYEVVDIQGNGNTCGLRVKRRRIM